MAVFRGLTTRSARRYVEGNFDLDLTYLRPNLIVMGFPAEKLESVYRNHIDSVVRFLDEKHKNHYKVYNLCAERTYQSSKFHHRVAHYPIKNGVPPPPKLIQAFCEDVKEWFSQNKNNVAVIHALGNKVRTCVMVCCVMLHQHQFKRAQDALTFYNSMRRTAGKVLNTPSQIRYVKYYEELISKKLVYKPHTLLLTKVQIDTVPRISNNTCSPSFLISSKDVILYKADFKSGVRPGQDVIILGENLRVPVCGDLKMEFYHRVPMLNTRTRMFQIWFNTFFIANLVGGDTKWVSDGEAAENKVLMLTLRKEELDKAAEDRTNKFFSPNLKVRLYFAEMSKLLTPVPPATTEDPMGNPFRQSEIDSIGLSDSDSESDLEEEGFEERNAVFSEDDTDHTPAEILARGEAALQAYREAILSGKKAVYRTRLMFVGQERVGKTSLKKRLMGERFDADEISTDGIEASSECLIDIQQTTSAWAARQQTQDTQDMYTAAVAEHMARQLRDQQANRDSTLQQQDNSVIPNQEEPSSPAAVDNELIPGNSEEEQRETELDANDDEDQTVDKEKRWTMNSSSESDDKRDSSNSLQVPIAVPDRVSEVLAGKLGDESEDNSNAITFSLWDFAGQELYYTTHQVFLSRRTVYIVVVNLADDFSKPDQGMVENPRTPLDRLDFWLQSIYSFTVGNLTDTRGNEETDQLSPPIIIVGTHKNSLGQTNEEREKMIDDKFDAIRDSLKGKCYREHVVNQYFAVENSLEEDESISDLRRKIIAVMEKEPYMGEEIPLRWLQFEESVKDAVEDGCNSMPVDEVQHLDGAKDIPSAATAELTTMLEFYHDLGAIMYHPKAKSSLRTLVILNPHWLIDVFRSIITVLDRKQQRAVDMKTWERLSNEGILADRLISLMWKDYIGDDAQSAQKKSALLELMEKYDLLVPQCRQNEKEVNTEETEQFYYVPSRLQEADREDKSEDSDASDETSTVFYIDFRGFLPIGFFHRIMARAVHWSQTQGGLAPELRYRRATFNADVYHNFKLEMSSSLQSVIQVVISPEEICGDSEASRTNADPIVCKKVKDFLSDTLHDLKTTWACGITYTFCVACPCNKGDQHFLDLDKCLSMPQPSAVLKCVKRTSVSVKKFLLHFCPHADVRKKEHDQISEAPVQTNLLKKYDLPSFLGGLEETYQQVSSPTIPFDLFTKLCMLLTPKQPLANDWRMLASKVGLDPYIAYLESRYKEPTAVVLRYWMESGQSLEELEDILKSMSRGDVARELGNATSR